MLVRRHADDPAFGVGHQDAAAEGGRAGEERALQRVLRAARDLGPRLRDAVEPVGHYLGDGA
jgi:hypothetical protein